MRWRLISVGVSLWDFELGREVSIVGGEKAWLLGKLKEGNCGKGERGNAGMDK